MTAKVNDPEAKRIQMAEQMRKSKKKDIISKRRQSLAFNQILHEGPGYSEQEYCFPSQEDEYGYEDFPQQPAQTVDHYLNNQQ